MINTSKLQSAHKMTATEAMENTIVRLDTLMDRLTRDFLTMWKPDQNMIVMEDFECQRIALEDICKVSEIISYAYSKMHDG